MADHRGGRRIEHEVAIAAPPERVWRALVEPVEAGRWAGGTVTLAPSPDGAVRFDWGEQGAVDGRVVALDPPRHLVMDWDGYPDPGTTRVAFALAPDGAGTAVSLVHSGYGDGVAWDGFFDGEATGWVDLLDALRRVVESGDHERR
ncbi:MAG: hypothetical protein AVDCRST_MAG73-4115 [uncultured Thermomicrobiales bacterium]|uniref:Activator of Hsp90 ATPase homologue 1/2-like C-terminal domain-containing protein n=1 Tax=uncultured Thermomicrobiales bacterium TaxID=1645740 RepID=A0A6J4V2K9_9BACT|nr:MAG: hypothetical protein AVDCRST_MAG73-4115 [uncultured Thermomicrobiales bacterium]